MPLQRQMPVAGSCQQIYDPIKIDDILCAFCMPLILCHK